MAGNFPGSAHAVPGVLYGMVMTEPRKELRPADPEKSFSIEKLLDLEFKRCPSCQANMTNDLCETCDHNDQLIEKLKEAVVLLHADVESIKVVANQLIKEQGSVENMVKEQP